jgi:hypothetical protein
MANAKLDYAQHTSHLKMVVSFAQHVKQAGVLSSAASALTLLALLAEDVFPAQSGTS